MKVPYSWLKELIPIDLPVPELAHRLTMAGLEAEKIETTGGEWDNVFVAVVQSVTPHPDADRLVLADVDAGEHRLTVVTGAPNIAEGQKVALAIAGARLIDGYSEERKYKTLKPGKIRGIVSEGMLCSERELGLSDEHEGILALEPDAPVGAPLSEWLGDTVIEFEITPNLVHAFSIYGIARETGAVTGAKVNDPHVVDLTPVPEATDLVRIEAPDLCYRLYGLVIDGITIEPSPSWMQRRLNAAGVRPVNNIVDVTNYVMLELGQPLHAFDRAALNGGSIRARRSTPAERIKTLDHQVRELPEDTLVIADATHAMAVAGTMGGVDSEVTDSTTTILLEAANFDMVSVRHTARALKMRTDASSRFERGLDRELPGVAIARAARLILDLCPGATVQLRQDVYPDPVQPRTVTLPTSKVEAVLGMKIEQDQMTKALTRLGFEPRIDQASDLLTVMVPSWRPDVTIQEDVIEEIARIVGYDRLPATLPTGTTPVVERDETFVLERSIRNLLIAGGGFEGRTYVVSSEADISRWAADADSAGFAHAISRDQLVRLRNPIQSDRPFLRTSIVPGLVDAVAENLKHERSVRLFEIGHVYLGDDPDSLPDEPSTLGIAIAGNRDPFDRFNARPGASDQLDFMDMKGMIELVLHRQGMERADWQRIDHPALHPGRAAEIAADGERLGLVGEVRPDLAASLEIEGVRLTVAELRLDVLQRLVAGIERVSILVDRFLPVEQDFAVVVPQDTPAADVKEALLSGAGPLATDVTLFDIYSGDQLGVDRKSLAFRVTFTAPDRALTDAELGKVRKRIERSLTQRVQGALRA